MNPLSFLRKAWPARAAPVPSAPIPVAPTREWNWPATIREPWLGAWQRNVALPVSSLLANATVFSCITLIASDIAKLRPDLLRDNGDDLWQPTKNSPFAPVLRRPNGFQSHIPFKESWLISKLTRGNTYVLKQRDARGVVSALYILDPGAVAPLVAPDGQVFYQLRNNDLAGLNAVYGPPMVDGIDGAWVAPASEVIHDRFNCLYHPLVGLSPLYAAALPATSGLTIGNASSNFFSNAARPSGILTAPGAIGDDTAKRLKDYWTANFTGSNAGSVAVLGDGLKFEPMVMTAVDAQLIEQLKWTAETICSVFHIPPFKVGVGAAPPTYANTETLNGIYYSDCLQSLIEAFEQCMDDGLELPPDLSVQLNLTALLRMDTAARFKAHSDAIGSGWMTPNEARKREDLPPVEGGDACYLQQQNYSLEALARRDRVVPAPPSLAGNGTAL